MDRRYRLIASPELLQIDYALLADEDINSTRYSVDGQWAIIEYKATAQAGFVLWNNDEACNFLEQNYNDWNVDSLAE